MLRKQIICVVQMQIRVNGGLSEHEISSVAHETNRNHWSLSRIIRFENILEKLHSAEANNILTKT